MAESARAELQRLLATHERAAQSVRETLALMGAAPKRGKVRSPKSAVRRRRGRKRAAPPLDTAAVLALFDPKVPVSAVDLRKAAGADANFQRVGLGGLVRHGYLKRKGAGYVRTAKAYTNGASA